MNDFYLAFDATTIQRDYKVKIAGFAHYINMNAYIYISGIITRSGSY